MPSPRRSLSHARFFSTPGGGFFVRMMQQRCSLAIFSGVISINLSDIIHSKKQAGADIKRLHRLCTNQ